MKKSISLAHVSVFWYTKLLLLQNYSDWEVELVTTSELLRLM